MYSVIIKEYPECIAHIEQTEQNCLIAVKQSSNALKLIKNPSNAVIDAALNFNALAIEHVKSPTREMIIAALKKNGNAIRFIDQTEEYNLLVV